MTLFAESLTEEQRNNIKIIAGDGAQWIDRAKEKYFPNAVRCVDFFHVNQWGTKALDDVRIIVQKMVLKDYEKLRREYTDAAKAAVKAAADLENAIKDAEEELAQMPKRVRPSKRKLELSAFLEESKAIQEELSR